MPNGSSDTLTTNSVTYSTNNPNDFLIILQGFCAEGAAGSGTPSGFTTIIGSGSAHVKSSNCASNFLQTNSFYKIVSETQDRKSTRLNSSHVAISYAVFCLKKKKKITE